MNQDKTIERLRAKNAKLEAENKSLKKENRDLIKKNELMDIAMMALEKIRL